MQREIGDKIQLGDTLTSLNDVSVIPAIDDTSNLKDVFGKTDKLRHLWDRGKADGSLIRYLPGGSKVSKQKKKLILFHKKRMHYQLTLIKKTRQFTVELAANTYTNYSKMTLFVPLNIKKSTDKNADVDVVTVNNFFACWLKEADIRRYPDDVRILLMNNTVEVYNYAAQQIKHLPTKSLDDIKETILYEKKQLF